MTTTAVSKREPQYRRGATTLFEFYMEGGGPIPDCLKGMYTSQTVAEIAKANYLYERDIKPQLEAEARKNFTRKATGTPVKEVLSKRRGPKPKMKDTSVEDALLNELKTDSSDQEQSQNDSTD
jgi:hypothetical protein